MEEHLALVLLIAAGLLSRSFWDLYNVRLGFDPQDVIAMSLWLPSPNDPATDIYGPPDRNRRRYASRDSSESR
jgi:hypothetical protein